MQAVPIVKWPLRLEIGSLVLCLKVGAHDAEDVGEGLLDRSGHVTRVLIDEDGHNDFADQLERHGKGTRVR